MRHADARSTSALPALLVAARLPCLATGTPQAATTIAAAVEMLTVSCAVTPVPQVSIRDSREIPHLPPSHSIADCPAPRPELVAPSRLSLVTR